MSGVSPIAPVLDFQPILADLCPDWIPFQITRLIVQWLRQHYVPGNIQQPAIQDNTWLPTDDTKILIESYTKWKPQLTEKRPGLIVKRHQVQALQDGIGNRMMGGAGAEGLKDYRSVRLVGSHSVFCVAGEGGEAEVLAAETYRELMKFAPKMTERLGLIRTVLSSIGEISLLEEATENFAIPVTIAYAFWDTWRIDELDAPLLARFNAVFNILP